MKTILVDAKYCFIIENENGFEIFKDMYKLLETYPNKKIILTNANDEQMLDIGLNNVPYEVFTLKHNPDKIDPEYYKKLLNKFSLTAEGVVYLEHDTDAIKSAQSIGIETYHFKDKRDLKSLKEFLDNSLK